MFRLSEKIEEKEVECGESSRQANTASLNQSHIRVVFWPTIFPVCPHWLGGAQGKVSLSKCGSESGEWQKELPVNYGPRNRSYW